MKALKSLLAVAIAIVGIASPERAKAQGFNFEIAEASDYNIASVAKGTFFLGYSNYSGEVVVPVKKDNGVLLYIFARSSKDCWPACGIYGTNKLQFSDGGFGKDHFFTLWFPSLKEGKIYKYYINTFEGIGLGVPMKVKWSQFTVPKGFVSGVNLTSSQR